jgi:hypothetical protein
MKTYNFEIYTKCPLTGQTGWEIKCISVFADSKADAKSKLTDYPLFDVIILFNYERDMNETDVQYYANGFDYLLTEYPYNY